MLSKQVNEKSPLPFVQRKMEIQQDNVYEIYRNLKMKNEKMNA